jgi:tetratricopeptide (TPR) repeat protein
MKRFLLILLFALVLLPAVTAGESLRDEQLNRGIRNTEPYSYMLIKQARMHPGQAKELLNKAIQHSPDLPAVYFEMAKASFSFTSQGLFEAMDNLVQGIIVYKRNFWWLFSSAGSVFVSLIFSFVLSMVVIIVIRLFHDVPLLSHDISEQKGKLVLLAFLASAVTGPLLLVGSMLMIFGLYMKKTDKIVVYLYLLFVLSSPWLFETASMFFQASASTRLKAVVMVNEAKDNKYALSVLRGSHNFIERFAYGLALKREGRYREAADVYAQIIAESPDARVYNNLGNCYMAMNDLGNAIKFYQRSVEINPSTAALYNLSQASRETFNFEKGDDYFYYAQRIDRIAVSEFRMITSRHPNRFVVDEILPAQEVWNYAREVKSRLPVIDLSIVPDRIIPFIAGVLILVFMILTIKVRQKAFRCRKCGVILCSGCEKRILLEQMCPRCYSTLVKMDELDARERVGRLLEVYDHQKQNRTIAKILSFILPGAAQVHAGDILSGLRFLWPFLFLLCMLFTNTVFITETSGFSHQWLNWSSLFFMAVIYYLSNVITRERIAKGWL